MIRSLSLQNFKSITNDVPLRLNNLSMICGSNSSGKSSVIQALLMLTQTFSSRYFKSSVSLNGRLVRLGAFSDILDYATKDNFINLEIKMEFTQSKLWIQDVTKVDLSIKFSGKEDQGKKFEGDFHPELIGGSAAVEKRDGSIESIKFDLPEKPNSELFSVSSFESKSKDSLSKDFPDYKIEGAIRQDLIPRVMLINYDHTKKISQQLISFLIDGAIYLKNLKQDELEELGSVIIPKAALDKIRSLILNEYNERIKNFEIPDEILKLIEQQRAHGLDIGRAKDLLARQAVVLTPDVIPLLDNPKQEGIDIPTWRATVDKLDEKVRKAFFDFLLRNRDTIQGVWYANMKRSRRRAHFPLPGFQELDHYLNIVFDQNIKYLGPLRNEPQAMYQAFDLTEPNMVGMKGEYTAAVLHINKANRINYPGIVVDEGNKISFTQKQDSLAAACTEWLTYLGVVTEVQTFDKGKLGYELQVKTTIDDKLQDLTHVGVGVSQVLPIVVMALLSKEDDVLIFEQPELHLHPKVQSRLCDFFLAMSSGTKQCIVETHSEYIINRLRLRIAQSRSNELSERSSILFIEKSQGRTKFKSIGITPYGAVVDWPKDFFDQTDAEVENILLEASVKKKELLRSKEDQKS